MPNAILTTGLIFMTFGEKQMNTNTYDLIILGGGLASLSLTRQLQLQNKSLKIAVIERQKHPIAEAAHKVGESLVEISTHYFKDRLKLEDHLKNDQLPKAGLRFFFSEGDNQDISKRIEFGASYFPDTPSFQIDRGRFENFLRETIIDGGADFLDQTSVLSVELSASNTDHTVHIRTPAETTSLNARWVVDATSRFGLLKRHLNLAEPVKHNCNSTWFRIKGTVDVDTWTNDPDFHAPVPKDFRYLSTNHLMGKGYWVWLIPLASGHTSVGVVVDDRQHGFDQINSQDKTLAWLSTHEPELMHHLKDKLDDIIDFHQLKHFSHGAKRVFSSERWALTGEAGVFLDPFYSPGSDFIAISNGFVADLILRDFQGEDIAFRTEVFNQQYLNIFKGFFKVYEDQYAAMGNADIMLDKITWDYANYWGSIALLYFNNKLTDLDFMLSIARPMQTLDALNATMQQHFQTRNVDNTTARPRFNDTLDNPFLKALNTDLQTPLTDDQLRKQLINNIDGIKALSETILASARETVS
jgi:flavin-dependent dehydrogenase